MRNIVLGLLAGLCVGPWAGDFSPLLGEVSRWVIQLIKALAVPLLFLAIVNAIHQTRMGWKSGARMLFIALLNAAIALVIGMGLSAWLRPGDALREIWSHPGAVSAGAPSAPVPQLKLDWTRNVGAWIPQSVLQPFVENAVIPVVILAILLGFALRHESHEEAHHETLRRWGASLETAQKVAERMLLGVTRVIPVAVFAAVASSVAKYGYGPLTGLFAYLGVALLGLALHIGLTYQGWVVLGSRIGLRRFWAEARTPVLQSIGTNSSLATLPFTLRALDRMGISRRSSALGACVGTNLNNDGILLYEGLAFLVVAQAMGVHLSFAQQLSAALLCVLTAMGIAGVPDAGFISLSLILTTVGIPTENLPILLSVDWILGRARSVTNVLSDLVLSIGIEGRSGHGPEA